MKKKNYSNISQNAYYCHRSVTQKLTTNLYTLQQMIPYLSYTLPYNKMHWLIKKTRFINIVLFSYYDEMDKLVLLEKQASGKSNNIPLTL